MKKWMVLLLACALLALCAGALAQTATQAEAESALDARMAEIAAAPIGSVVRFGRYEQDGDEANGGEEIEWLVAGRAGEFVCLLCVNILDAQPYGDEQDDWRSSHLRAFLNGEFLDAAFTPEEQRCLVWRAGGDLYDGNDENLEWDELICPTDRMDTCVDDPSLLNIPPVPTVHALLTNSRTELVYWQSTGLERDVQHRFTQETYNKGSIGGVRPACIVYAPAPEAAYEVVPLEAAGVGSVVRFGRYEQDGDAGNGAEPIDWVVMDRREGQLLLYAVDLLDAQPYDTQGRRDAWYTSSLRAFLGGEFLSAAFTPEERGQLVWKKCRLSGNEVPPSNTLDDLVFLLGYDQYDLDGLSLGSVFIPGNYPGTVYEGTGVEAFELAEVTPYVSAIDIEAGEYYWEWSGTAKDNMPGGYGHFHHIDPAKTAGVRPACWVSIPPAQE